MLKVKSDEFYFIPYYDVGSPGKERTLGSLRITRFPTSADTPDNSPLPLAKWDSPPPCPGQGFSFTDSEKIETSREGQGGQKQNLISTLKQCVKKEKKKYIHTHTRIKK